MLSLKAFCQTNESRVLTIPSFVQIAKDTKPSVVNIYTTKPVKKDQFNLRRRKLKKNFWAGDNIDNSSENIPAKEIRRRNLGSGVIIDKEGYIVTNNHVIAIADEIKVSLLSGEEFDGKIVGTDPKTDLALIKIEASKDLPVPKLGDSDKLEVGEWIMAIGNPVGLEQTVTVGIVSAKGRVIGVGPYDDFIQTDAPFNPGSSGGPLINTQGEVVGINTLRLAKMQGLGFAIPINMVKGIIGQLRERGRVIRGWLGVLVERVFPELSTSSIISNGKGALVSEVKKDGPAYKGGLKQGDVIIKFDGKDIEDMNELPRIVALTPVGKEVEVKIIREGKERILRVGIEELVEEKKSSSKESKN